MLTKTYSLGAFLLFFLFFYILGGFFFGFTKRNFPVWASRSFPLSSFSFRYIWYEVCTTSNFSFPRSFGVSQAPSTLRQVG